MAGDAALVFALPGLRLVDANRAACRSLAYGRKELLAMRLSDVAPHALEGPLAAAIREIGRRESIRATVATVQRSRCGLEFAVEVSLRTVSDRHGLRVVMVSRPVCADPAAADFATARDALTGLAGRGWLERGLRRAIERARREDGLFALFFLDVDHFKRVNDSCGHLAGDAVLRTLAARLTGCLRPTDLVARYGGDEFAALVDTVRDRCQVVEVARRIRRRIVGRKAEAPSVTASIGVAIGTRCTKSVEELIARADQAMYRAKAMGRNGHWVLDAVTDC